MDTGALKPGGDAAANEQETFCDAEGGRGRPRIRRQGSACRRVLRFSALGGGSGWNCARLGATECVSGRATQHQHVTETPQSRQPPPRVLALDLMTFFVCTASFRAALCVCSVFNNGREHVW